MPTKSVEAAINDQIAKEFYAAHLYLSMVAWFEDRNLPGFAHWMRMQTEEERAHAMRLFNYLIETGGKVKLQHDKLSVLSHQPNADIPGVLQCSLLKDSVHGG